MNIEMKSVLVHEGSYVQFDQLWQEDYLTALKGVHLLYQELIQFETRWEGVRNEFMLQNLSNLIKYLYKLFEW